MFFLRPPSLPALMVGLLLFTGCGLFGSDDPDTALALGTMKAQIDGKDWEAVNATANRVFVGGLTQVTITGATIQAEGISFSLTDTGPGSYTIDDQVDPARDVLSASYTRSIGQTYLAQSGALEITRFDEEAVEGSFSFEARNTSGQVVSVTNGSFRVGYGPSIGS